MVCIGAPARTRTWDPLIKSHATIPCHFPNSPYSTRVYVVRWSGVSPLKCTESGIEWTKNGRNQGPPKVPRKVPQVPGRFHPVIEPMNPSSARTPRCSGGNPSTMHLHQAEPRQVEGGPELRPRPGPGDRRPSKSSRSCGHLGRSVAAPGRRPRAGRRNLDTRRTPPCSGRTGPLTLAPEDVRRYQIHSRPFDSQGRAEISSFEGLPTDAVQASM